MEMIIYQIYGWEAFFSRELYTFIKFLKQAHGVAWDYAEFSLEREEYLDEMWEKYKEDLAQP